MSARNVAPTMNEQHLLATIKLIFPDLEVDIRDIKNPTQAFIGNFYALFLEDFGADINELSQIQMKQMTIISHVDMYSQTIPHINMYEAVNFFYKNIGINDFNYSDLVNPNPKRTVAQLSAIMAFLQHCDSAVHDIQDSIEQLKLQKSKKEELLSKIESLKKDINQRATNRVKRNERIKELEQIIEKDRQKLDELFKEKETQKQTMDEIKRLIAQDEQKELEYVKTISGLKEENEKLGDMIVKSPNKLKSEWQTLEDKKEEFVSTVKSLQEQIEEKKKLNNLIVNECAEQEGRIQKLNELLEMEKSIEEMNNRLDSIKKKHSELAEEIDELKLKNTNWLQTLKSLKNSYEELKARKLKQDAENKEALETSEKEYQEWVKKCQDKSEYENKLHQAIDEANLKVKQLESDVTLFHEYLMRQYNSLCSQEKEIMNRFDKILDSASQRNHMMVEEDL
ncbi:kinetochore protein Nuf2-like [Planococcus citri]|uniref:kinetochore protein Nuf2-like n=1 Tax=Planococcus citri TaxID=170843 RepID=UPI0031F7BE04